jgi:HEAT repeat protein
LIANIGPENITNATELEQVLLDASNDEHDELRQTAAFALGILGSETSLEPRPVGKNHAGIVSCLDHRGPDRDGI